MPYALFITVFMYFLSSFLFLYSSLLWSSFEMPPQWTDPQWSQTSSSQATLINQPSVNDDNNDGSLHSTPLYDSSSRSSLPTVVNSPAQRWCIRGHYKDANTANFDVWKTGKRKGQFYTRCRSCKPASVAGRKRKASVAGNPTNTTNARPAPVPLCPTRIPPTNIPQLLPVAAHAARHQRAWNRHGSAHSAPSTQYLFSSIPQITPMWQGPGPVHSSDWANIQDMRRMLNSIEMEFCTRCKERWFEMQLVDGICRACRCLRDKKMAYGDPFLMGWHNQMDPGLVPTELACLTTLEEMIIARVHLHLQVWRVRGLQYHYTGHCVSFWQNSADFISILPTLPENINLLLLRPSSKDAEERHSRQFAKEFHVNRENVTRALLWLKENNPLYFDITIDDEAL